MNKKELFTELSIKFAVLEAKVDKLLELAMKNENHKVDITYTVSGVEAGSGGINFDPPPQWPNESSTDYLKRIGQYVEAQSDSENFEDVYK